jgi:hypothetical protein
MYFVGSAWLGLAYRLSALQSNMGESFLKLVFIFVQMVY